MAVARDHLGRHRFGFEAQFFRDMGFDAGIDIGEGADRAGYRAGGNLLARRLEPRPRPHEFGVKARKLDAERGRLGMDAMAAPDGRGVFVLQRALLQRGQQLIDVCDQNVGGAAQLHREARVQHIGRGHALMHETRFGADDLRQMRQERDDVVFDFTLDLVDAFDSNFALRAFSQIFAAASLGMTPSSASASAAWASISNQMRNLVSADQIAVISARA